MFETQIDDDLRLRTFCEDDAETLFRVVDENRAHLREWLPWLDANTTSKDSLAFIQATLRQEADNQGFTCAVEFRGRIVGVAGYHPIRWYNKSVEIGYWLAREAVGHGIMTKCCQVLISHAFAVYGLNRVQIPAAVGNRRSRAIPERLGFQMEGIIRDAEWLYDHFVDHAMYAMLKKDWNGAVLAADDLENGELNMDILVTSFVAEAEKSHSDALVIRRHDAQYGEWYFGKPVQKIESMSVTKFVVGMGVGKLLTDGLLKNLDTPVCEFFQEWKQGKKRLVTVRHLLAHTSGLQNVPKTMEEIYPSADFVQLALCAELTTDPGAEWSYNNKAANLLAGIFNKVVGIPMDEYIAENLFKPLGIVDYEWTRDKAGNPHAMAGLKILPTDLAKLGQLALNNGRWGAQQIITEQWFDMATKPGLACQNKYGLMTELFYGETDTVQSFGHTGWLGQFLLVFPLSRIVLVRMIHGSPDYNPTTDSFQTKTVDDLLGQLAEVKPRQFSADDYKVDAAFLAEFMGANYPYIEDNQRFGVDIMANSRNMVARAASADSDREFWRLIREFFAPLTAHDPHTMVFPPNKYRLLAEEMKAALTDAEGSSGPWAEIAKPLIADETAKANRYWTDILPANEMPDQGIKDEEGPWYEIRRVDDRVALIRFNYFPSPSAKTYQADLKKIREFAAEMASQPYLFIDLRGNRGGYNSWHDIVEMLTPRELTSENLILFRGGSESSPMIRAALLDQLKPLTGDAFTGVGNFEQTFKYYRRSCESHSPAKDGVRYAGVVCLLTDERTYSAADGMADFAKASGWAVVAGRKTAGGGVSLMPLWGVLPHTKIVFRYHTGLALSANGNVLRCTRPHLECREGDIFDFARNNLDAINRKWAAQQSDAPERFAPDIF